MIDFYETGELHDELCELVNLAPPFLGPVSCMCHERASLQDDLTDEQWSNLLHRQKDDDRSY